MKKIKNFYLRLIGAQKVLEKDYILEDRDTSKTVEITEPIMLQDVTPEFLTDFGNAVKKINGFDTEPSMNELKLSLVIERVNK